MWSKEVPKEEGMYYAYDIGAAKRHWQIAHVWKSAGGKPVCVVNGHFSFDFPDMWYYHVPITDLPELPPNS